MTTLRDVTAGGHIETDVLIIGAGIAGAALACALRDSALDVALLEKNGAPLDTARGDHLQPNSLEILERWEVLDDFFANGAEKRLGSVWYSANGATLLHSSVAELDVPHPYFLFLNHERIGETLLHAALQGPNVSIERPIRNWWLEDRGADAVEIRVGRTDGSDVTIRARVVVGADGRNSRVRKQFGIGAESHRYERPIVVLFARPAKRDAGNELEVYLNEKQMVAVIPRTGGDCKIGIPVDQEDIAAWRAASADELRQKLLALAPHLDVSEARYADVYAPVFLRADSWVSDNVVLVGDACHAIHPARSQGMNIAIRCIDELARALRQSAGPMEPDTVGRALTDYQDRLRPAIDAMLEKNHEHGLAMDRSGAEDYAETCAMLKNVQSNPAMRRAFSMNAAGYAKSAD